MVFRLANITLRYYSKCVEKPRASFLTSMVTLLWKEEYINDGMLEQKRYSRLRVSTVDTALMKDSRLF